MACSNGPHHPADGNLVTLQTFKNASAVYIMFIVIKIKKNIQNFKGFLIKRMRKDKKNNIMWSVTETHNQKR